ncbi:predicted protein [Botrytis cinerea T4]|uniref:Uncharacterized protein n=1 Tax=Botryotinia fuckeliana (strain T4) TaxID=999810 RepID=G2YG73_BOTF4|nr:predicted protein [Botrytis cinerea T4]
MFKRQGNLHSLVPSAPLIGADAPARITPFWVGLPNFIEGQLIYLDINFME